MEIVNSLLNKFFSKSKFIHIILDRKDLSVHILAPVVYRVRGFSMQQRSICGILLNLLGENFPVAMVVVYMGSILCRALNFFEIWTSPLQFFQCWSRFETVSKFIYVDLIN
jgi:hypothetical protein